MAALPPFVARWDPSSFTYTDGSKTLGCPTLGAAIFHAPIGRLTRIDASGFSENNSVNRAKLVAIHQALLEHRDTPERHLLTDSLGSIQKIMHQLRNPRCHSRNYHLHLLQAVALLIFQRDTQPKFVTSLRKVPAHAGIAGNESADSGVKDVVKAHGAQQPDTVVHRLGAAPHRLPTWAFAKADKAPAMGKPSPLPHAFTHAKHMRPPIQDEGLEGRDRHAAT